MAFDCTKTLPMEEWVQCDADGAATAFRTWSASVAGGGKIWHWGGGHNDYSGNGVLLYDIATDEWVKATTNESWRNSDTGGFDSYLDEWTEVAFGPDCYSETEKNTIQSAFTMGETQRPETTLLGRPFVRHVYNQRMYWPDMGDMGMFCTAVAGFWCYDPAQGDSGGDDDCEYDGSNNAAWTRFSVGNVQDPPTDGLETLAYSYDAELDGGSLVVFGGGNSEKVKTSTDGINWEFVRDGAGDEFLFGSHIEFGATLTAYAENRGIHFVALSVNLGPTSDLWFQVDLTKPQSVEIPGPVEAAGATSGIIFGISYDAVSQTLLAIGKFDGEVQLWQYNIDGAFWTQLELAGSIPTTETSGDRFDYLNYDRTTGRHYYLRGAVVGGPIEVYAFRVSETPPPPPPPEEEPEEDTGDTTGGGSTSSGGNDGGGGSMSLPFLVTTLLGALGLRAARTSGPGRARSDNRSFRTATVESGPPKSTLVPRLRAAVLAASIVTLAACGGGGGSSSVSSGGGGGGGGDDGGGGSGSGSTSNSFEGCDPAQTLPTTVTVNNTQSTEATGVPVTFGQVFCAGAIPAGKTIMAQTDTEVVPLQIDTKATHGDGSLRHAILSAGSLDVPGSGSGPLTLQLDAADSATAPSGTTLTTQNLLDGAFDATVTVTLSDGGGTYSASAADIITDAMGDGNPDTPEKWLDGPVVSEWLLTGDLEDGAGTPHPHLHVRFHVRAYSINRIRVAVVLENGWTFVPDTRNFTYSLTITDEKGDTELSQAGIEHHNRARWRHVFWTGVGEPAVNVAHEIGYLRSVGAVPNYDPAIPVSDASLGQTFDGWMNNSGFMDVGLLRTQFGDTGWHAQIGPLPRWTVRYLLTQDNRAKRAMLGTAEQGGSFDIHFRDKSTGLPVSIDDHPGLNIAGWTGDGAEFVASCDPAGSCDIGIAFDMAHQPSNNYVPYLVTGDYFFLEELQFWSTYNLLNQDFNEVGRNFEQGILWKQQTRGQGWTIRNLGYTAYITPDAHPMKAYWEEKLANNAQWYTDAYVNKTIEGFAWANDQGWIGRGQFDDRDHIKPWMDAFMGMAVAHLANGLGYSDWQDFYEWKSKFPVDRATSNSWCWFNGAARVVDISPNDAVDSSNENGVADGIFDSLLDIYQATAAHDHFLNSCFTEDPAADCSVCTLAEGQGNPEGAVQQFAKFNMELAAARDSGIANSEEAWNLVCNRSLKPSAAAIEDGPTFQIIPRVAECE